MKKTYMAPTMVSENLTVQSHLLGVSLSDDESGINNIDIDSDELGGIQMVKGNALWYGDDDSKW